MRPLSILFVSFLFLILSYKPAAAFLIDQPGTIDILGYSARYSKNAAVEKLYQDGLGFLAKKEYDKAQKAFEKSLEKDAKYVNSILGLSETYFMRKQINQAGAILSEALTRIKDDDGLYMAWGRYLYTQKKFDKAEAAFKKAITLNPGSDKPLLDLADLYMNTLNKPEDAIILYRAVLKINPNNAGAHYALGIALSNLGKYPDDVIAHLIKANQLEPKNALPLEALSKAFVKIKDFPKALEALDKILVMSPKFTRALILKGDVYLSMNDTDKALETFTKVTQNDPKFVLAYTKLGMTHQLRNEQDLAISSYRKSLSLDPKQPLVLNNLAWVLFEKKSDLNEALRTAEKANELAPNVLEFQDTLNQIKAALSKQ